MGAKVESMATSIGHSRNQYYAVFAVNLISFSHGCMVGWITPVLPLLKSSDTPLTTGPLTLEDVSWIASIAPMGSVVSALILRWLTTRMGSKRMMTNCLAIVSVICWLLLAFGRTKYEILLSRFMCGFIATGIDSAIILFVAEISDDRIRGKLGSMALLIRSIGYTLSFIIGAYVEYSIVPFIYVGIPIVFFACLLFLPNTPPHLIRMGKFDDAKKSIKFYKGYTGQTSDEYDAVVMEYERLIIIANQQGETTDAMTFKKFCKPKVFNGILVAIVLTFLNQYCGWFTLMIYSVVIFQESGTHIDPHISSIIMGAMLVVGNLSSTSLVETLGRKCLLTMSMAGSTVGLSAMASYMYLDSLGFELAVVQWIPVASLCFVIFASSVGIVPLLILCIVEKVPTEARSFGLAVSIIALNIFASISVNLFPILSETIQLHGCMAMYAICSAFGIIFVTMAIEETKGKSLHTINKENHIDQRE